MRFGLFFFAVVTCVTIGCGKDAAIQITKPEPPQTRRVRFSIASTDQGNVHAAIKYGETTLQIDRNATRSIELPLGKDVELKAQLPEGWEIKDWNVSPGGNVDFSKEESALKVANVQEDTSVVLHVQKISAADLPQQHRVNFSLEAEGGDGDVTADISYGETLLSAARGSQRSFDVAEGEDVEFKAQLPAGWIVKGWNVSSGANTDLSKDNSSLKISDLTQDTTVSLVAVKPPPAQPPKTFKVGFSMEASDEGAVTAEILYAGNRISMDKNGRREIELPMGSDVEFKAQLPEGWSVKEWKTDPAGNSDFVRQTNSLKLYKIQSDTRATLVLQKQPPKKIEYQTIKFLMQTPSTGEIGAKFTGSPNPITFNGAGQRILSLPRGSAFDVALSLPHDWEVESWKVSGEIDHDDNGTKSNLHLKSVTADAVVAVKVRPVPLVDLQIRVKGKSYFHLMPGSGSVKVHIFKPGENPTKEVRSLFYNGPSINTVVGIKDFAKAASQKVSIENGSTVLLQVYGVDGDGKSRTSSLLFKMEHPKRIDIDFTRLLGEQSGSLESVLGLNELEKLRTTDWE